MGKQVFVAAFFIFLSLSMTPIDARRVQETTAKVQAQMQGGSSNLAHTEWHIGSTPEEKCARWKTDFETKMAEVREGQSNLKHGAGALATARLVLKVRSMTKVYELAARRNCQWVEDRDVETEDLQAMISDGLAENPCFPQAQALMAEEWETAAQQNAAMNLAVQMLIQQRCTAEDLEQMQDEMDNVEGSGEVDVELEVEALSQQVDEDTDAFVTAIMESPEGGDSLLQVDSTQLIANLEQLVALVAFLLIWAVLCIVFVPVAIMVVGAVLCTLSWVLRRFLSRGGNLSSCMNWWSHQTQQIFSEGNELMMAGACVIAGWLGFPHVQGFNFYFPGVHVHHR